MAACPLHPYAGFGRPLRKPDARHPMDMLGACQGHLDVRRLGASRKAGVGALDRDVHGNRLRASRALAAGTWQRPSQLPRSRPCPLRRIRRRALAAATARIRRRPSGCSASVAPSRRRATTSCSRRWPCCPPTCNWRFEPYRRRRVARQAGRAGGRTRHRRPRLVEGWAGAGRRACALPAGRHFRAGLPHHRRRRPRRPAQRAGRGVEPGPGLRFDRYFRRARIARRWRQRACRAARGSGGAGGGTRKADARPGIEAAPRLGGRAKGAVRASTTTAASAN